MPSTDSSRVAAIAVATVYGTLLNDRATVDRLAEAFTQPPYKAPPKAPVLYVKPRNTLASEGAEVAIPPQTGEVRIDATVGAVIGRRATKLSEAEALDYVSGYRVVSDITLAHENYYRPSIQLRCRDGFCPMSEPVTAQGFDLACSTLVVKINGQQVHERRFADLVRPLPRLIADVTEFMTLEAGDVLLVGPPEGAPLARPGDRVELEVPGLGKLSHTVVFEINGGARQ
ncbi:MULTISPECIES: fumarylacetoacetate hydrolase family protein [unclassified Variovorax]|uniref:fumarylacetoacetate hydrolase family protein n=1 Tax=unclassified Variovorax TaxID=663243 RepID=UPI00076C3852|nr:MULTISPECIES: fumarylacetoacetate hydrolase family protein [unclassified Variovorax]KWT70660.1 5-carboxymethyl-2-oxo-hex-3- ene-1,7-dioate decarboxylase [Variovorax sp. WDL1]PNG47125.1 Homoprotocatechuate catabolism bifunctional isomerase/decarboxylase [Variovorax sp. B2]PNG48224.1 Homoprotocatechuate catabolism bifunctional isomerase/decarboxylase [Variovorax sp. B4]VTV14992.1 Homoprotocatechuate catabolism bifunctional isomerase/decarboxylase [Variovorax sp. WDL1]